MSSVLFAAAGTFTWDADGTPGGATGGSGSWDTSSLFWNSAGTMRAWTNTTGDMALFGGTSGTITLGAPIAAGGLLFNTTGYTIAGGGNTLSLSGSPMVTVTSAGDSATIQSNLVLGADTTFGGAGSLTIDGTLTTGPGLVGYVTLNKVGSGTVYLNGSNSTSTITTTISGGILSIATSSNLTAGRVTLNGGTLQSTGSSTMTNGINLGTAGGAIDVASGQTLGIATGFIRGHGSLTKTGNGTLQISIASTYLGATTISGGTVSGGAGSFLPVTGGLSVASGAALNLNGFGTSVASISGAGTITNTGSTAALTLGNVSGSQDTTFSGSFDATTPAALTLTKTGGGTLSITSSVPGTATGTWTLNAGTVNVDYTANGAATGNMLTSRAMALSGGNLKITGRAGATVAQGLGAITVGARGTQIIMVPSGGTSTTLTLGAMAHPTTAGASLLVNAPANTTVKTTTSGSTGLGIFGGRFVFTDGTNYNWATTTGSTPFTITGYSGYTALATAAGVDTLNSSLTGSATLAGDRTTNTLKLTTSGSGQSLNLATYSLALTGGGLLFTGANDYSLTSSTGSLQSNSATTGDLVIHQYGSGTLTLDTVIKDGTTGATALTKAGPGTLVLSKANTFTGAISINNGTLSVSDGSQLGNAAAPTVVTINDGATFKTTANTTIAGTGTASHTFALPGGMANFDIANATTLILNGAISGAGGLSLTNTGTLQLNVAAAHSGPTYVGPGATLRGGVASFLTTSSAGVLTVASNGTVEMNNFTLVVGNLSGSGTITNSGGTATTLTIGSGTVTSLTNPNSTFSGTLSGAIALSKNGGGSLTLTNPATYTGASTVANGAVIFGVNNALPAGALTMGNTAGPATSLLDLNGFNWTSGAVTFYGTSSSPATQSTINIGAGGVLTLGGTVTLSLNAAAANSGLPAFITGGTIDFLASRSFAINDSPNAAVDLTITSNITSTGGAFSLTKTGAGTMALTGNVNIGGSIAVSAGVLETKGTLSTGAGGTTVGSVLPGTLRLTSGGSYSTTTMAIGATAANIGSLVVRDGALNITTSSNSAGISIGSAGYGGMFLSGGTINTQRIDTVEGAAAASVAVIQVSGTGTLNAASFLMFRNQRWEFTVNGGRVNHNTTGHIALGFRGAAGAAGVMNVIDGLVDNTGFSVTIGQQNDSTALGNVGLNLNGGTLLTTNILHYLNAAAATTSVMNFNGGTLKAAATTGTFVGYTGSGGTGTMTAYVNGAFGSFNGGAVIDSNGFAVTMPIGLSAPTGNGVFTIPVTAGGSGYIGAPYVEISGGGGSGAAATAVVDLDPASATYGKVIGITVTNPGVGYTSAPTVTLLGGGGTGATVDVATVAANTSGGLTKVGNGSLTITGANTYTGPTIVNGGTLAFGALANTLSGGIFINAGTLTGGANANTFGTDANLITLGASSGNADATVGITFNGGTVKQPILVKGGNTGIASILLGVGSSGTTLEGAVTLDDHDVVIGKTGATSSSGILTGGITGTGDVTINNTSTAGTITLSGSSINPVGTVNNTGVSTGTTTISAVIGTNVTSVVQNSAATSLTLGATANTWTGGLIIKAGTVTGGAHVNTFGPDSNLITLGDASGSADTTLGIFFNNGTVKQPILVKGGNTGIATLLLGVGATETVWEGAVTLNNHDLVIGKTGTTTTIGTLAGGITGTGNVTVNNTTVGGQIVLSGSSLNQVGTLTHTGTSAVGTMITAVIGTNVTSVVQNSATTPLLLGIPGTGVLAQANLWTGGLIIKSGTVTGGANNNTFGADTNLITLGDTTGSANTTIGITFNSSASAIKQPILVKGGNTGIATILLGVGSSTTIWDSAVTLDNHDVTIGKTGGTSSVGTLRGGVTGTGNITLRNTTNQGGITLSVAAINPVGWITHTSTTTGTTTISAVIGSNVTDVTQNTATSPFVLSGTAANAYTGTTSVLAGTMDLGKSTGVTAIPGNVTLGNGTAAAVLRLLNSNQIADTSRITFSGSGATAGILRLNNKDEVIGGLSSTGGAGIVENESGSALTGTLSVNVASGSHTFGGLLRDGNGVDIDGVLALTKLGAGTQILTGSNTYTGATLIQGGVLQIGSGGLGKTGFGAVTVKTGGTLSGTGVVQGISFTAESGSTLHVGDGTSQSNYGTLTLQPVSGSGVFDLQAASTIQLGINPGGTSDLLKFMGLGTNTLLLNGNLTVTAGSFTPVSEEVFNLLDWSGLTNAPTFASRYTYTGMLFGNGDEAAGLDLPDVYGSGYAWDISNFITDGSIALISIVPEPSRALLLGLALSLVVARRRRPANA